MQRSDAPLIKHLTKTYGPEMAKSWQRPPLVLLPGDGFVEYLREHRQEMTGHILRPERLPWNDFVLDYADGFNAITRFLNTYAGKGKKEYVLDVPNASRWWTRIRTLHRIPDDLEQHVRNIMGRKNVTPSKDAVLVETWNPFCIGGPSVDSRQRLHSIAILLRWNEQGMSFMDLTCSWRHCALCGGPTFQDGKGEYEQPILYDQHLRLALWTLGYFASCDEYFAQVSPGQSSKPMKMRQERVQGEKPWFNEALPHYILLDPKRAREYGHPSAQHGPIGHHASPRPHTRRGHWAVLQSDRFERNTDGTPKRVWRKQAWVGATEWTDGLNQRYRLVTPAAAEEPYRRLALVT